jgi:HAD superfamily hydrolase (TIGR01490 family)
MAKAPANSESTVDVDADAARASAPDPTAPVAAGVRHEWSYWPGGQQAAFFDLDRTLIAGSSAFTFAIGAWRKDMVPTGQFAKDAVGAIAFKLRGDAGDESVAKVRARILHAVEGSRQQDLVALNETIVPKLLSKVRPEARTLLESHTQRGHATYIVSAAPVEIVEPLALALGMTAGLGTRAVVVDGIYTGALAGPFCYGPGKVDAIKEVAHWEGFDLSRCYAYSDSASDLPMLEAVGHPVAVNPDGRLGAAAATRGWPVVIFRRRTRQVVRRSTAGAAAVSLAGAGFAAGYQVARRR